MKYQLVALTRKGEAGLEVRGANEYYWKHIQDIVNGAYFLGFYEVLLVLPSSLILEH